MLNIGIEKKHTVSIITVLVSTTKLDINPKISFVFCLKLGFPGTTIQIVRVPGNNFENSNRGERQIWQEYMSVKARSKQDQK